MRERVDNTVICQYRPRDGEIGALWERMATMVEDRAMGPGMAFPHFGTREIL